MTLIIILSFIVVIAVAAITVLNHPSFGRLPRGERLERIKKSPNFRDGEFRNQYPTVQITSGKSMGATMLEFFFRKKERLQPKTPLPIVKTDLFDLDIDEDLYIWFGHSSYFLQADGKRFLVDPVLTNKFPMSFMFRPFKGTDVFTVDDIPDVDYLVITHDHWDHLDYYTVKALKDRIGKVICSLGVGEYFEYWGFDKRNIIELDWYESASLPGGFTVNCLPSRHFSGRGLSRNPTLWASYLLQTPSFNIYMGGDGGYDKHFKEVADKFTPIDLAIMENGQYDKNWCNIHLMPEDLEKAIKDLNAIRVVTVHNSKFALSKHPWDEPLNNASEIAERDSIRLLIPRIGEAVFPNDSTQKFVKWWRGIE